MYATNSATASVVKPMANGGWVQMKSLTLGLKDSAPVWVREDFLELTQKFGLSAQDALTKLRQSPFFDENWLK